jgi:hypothetical protein
VARGAQGFEVGHVHFPGVHFGGGRASARWVARRVGEGTTAQRAGEGREGTVASEVVGREGTAAAWSSGHDRVRE